MSSRNCLILTQYREGSEYNDFIGRFYHFPASEKKSYLSQFDSLPIEFVYFEPEKEGKGQFFGYGKITKPPFKDKREPDHFFVEVSEYNPFLNPVYFKNDAGEIIEKRSNPEHYNPNNSVRKINPRLLDELCLDGGILLNFTADSHLVQVLGEQLISSERVGVLELVKNSFDAGASHCRVKIEKIPNLEKLPDSSFEFGNLDGPVIVIEDDGLGMTMEQIVMGWLRPASTLKTNVKERLRQDRERAIEEGRLDSYNRLLKQMKDAQAQKGRIPLGEKGIGRFACHRLGRKLLLRTKVAQNDYEYVLKINWDEFNILQGAPKGLEDVKISLTREVPSRDYGPRGCGTQLVIYGGLEGFEFTRTEIAEIHLTLQNLNSPFPSPHLNQPEFFVSFTCPQVPNLVDPPDLIQFPSVFTINGIVDEYGVFDYEYAFKPPGGVPLPAFDLKKQTLDLMTIDQAYWQGLLKNDPSSVVKPACGQFYIHIDVWYREPPWIDKTAGDFKAYLTKYGGLSIYRDGIIVFPAEWGSESDWLNLRQKQIGQAYRMSYYHMIGNIELDQTTNIDLIDKTDRQGLIKNRAFSDLTSLVRSIVTFVENDYIGKRDDYAKVTGDLVREPRNLRAFTKQSAKLISNISTNYDLAVDQYKLFEDIKELGDAGARKGKLVELHKSMKNLEENLKLIQEVQDLLTEQAGFGLGIAVALHEITKTASNFYFGIAEMLKRGKLDTDKLEELKDASKSLESEIARLAPLRALRNEKPVRFKVSRSIKYVHSVFKRRFESLRIDFDYNKGKDFEIVARYGALNQILSNLFDNACYWMENPKIRERKLRVLIGEDDRSIVVADNGPGIHDSLLPYLFQPGYSLKFPPSGIGLYVCKHYMNLMKKRGDIYLAKERDRIPELQGAQFMLDFSKVLGENKSD